MPACLIRAEIAKPRIPEKVFTVVGCKAEANPADNSRAIQAAIDTAAAKGGGHVTVPAGAFVCGPIALRNSIDLHLEKGARLLMSQNFEDFATSTKGRRAGFIEGVGLHDVRISGEGVFDGQGEPWWKEYRQAKASAEKPGFSRPQLLSLLNCERLELDGFSTLNPPNTHCSIRASKDITIDHLTMTAPGDSPNTDALNLNLVQNVLITNCDIRTGDDNIVLLGTGNNDPANPGVRNVSIRDCKLGVGHGLSIGSYTSSGIQDVHAENISFDGTTSGIRLKAARDRGGLVKNLSYKHITMHNVRAPIALTSYYPKTPASPAEDVPHTGEVKLPEWTGIDIEDVTITGGKNSIIIWGLPEKHVQGLTLKRVKAEAQSGAVVFHGDVTFSEVEITAPGHPLLRTFDAKVEGIQSSPFEGNYKIE